MKNEKIVLVTGANKGIGFEVVRQLARLGFRVFLGARNVEAGRAAAEKLSADGTVSFLEIDVSDGGSISRAAEQFAQHANRLDVLVNNAGILLDEDKAALKITPDISRKPCLQTRSVRGWYRKPSSRCWRRATPRGS